MTVSIAKKSWARVLLPSSTALLDNNTGKTVALKVLKSHSVKELKRFRREGTVLSTVRHPNIVKIYELQLEEQPAYLTMEYLEGPSLAQLLEKA